MDQERMNDVKKNEEHNLTFPLHSTPLQTSESLASAQPVVLLSRSRGAWSTKEVLFKQDTQQQQEPAAKQVESTKALRAAVDKRNSTAGSNFGKSDSASSLRRAFQRLLPRTNHTCISTFTFVVHFDFDFNFKEPRWS